MRQNPSLETNSDFADHGAVAVSIETGLRKLMKKHLAIARSLLFVLCALLFGLASRAFAQVHINIGIPGLSAEPKPTEFIAQLYNFALMISGVLALGAIVYGGVRYMTAAGNPSGQTEAREWIQGAIFGLLLLFGAYFLLNIINPDLTKLSLPTLSAIPASQRAAGGVPTNGGLIDAEARALLAGIDASGVNLTGIQRSTVDELISLKRDCARALGGGCIVIVTSAAGDVHRTTSKCTHANGFKADLRPNLSVNNFITRLTPGAPRGDGAPTFTHNGAIYADERTKPSNCGTTCHWTAPHWDMAVGC